MESKIEGERKVKVRNNHLEELKYDHFHHLGISSNMKHFNDIFSDVKFVCFGGSSQRMEKFARKLQIELNMDVPLQWDIRNICSATDRYVMFKAGQVLCVNHGIGMSSTFVVLHEVIKALYYSRASGVYFFRVGTSGGIGIAPGSVVITKQAFDAGFRSYLEVPVLGEIVKKESKLDEGLGKDLLMCREPEDKFDVVYGNTICSWDFYEGQGRLDGAICNYDEVKKMEFLRKAHNEHGIRNMEMESLCFGSLCFQADIKAAVVCVTYLNRFNGDQISSSPSELSEWQDRPMMLVTRFMKKHLKELKCSS